MNYTLTEAIEYAKDNKLDLWIQNFLRNCNGEYANPNVGLADGLLIDERFYFEPMEVNLKNLQTIRIEEDIKNENELKHYIQVVNNIVDSFLNWDMPPLIVEYRDEMFYLTDGNHRYSALRKMNIESQYAIIWCSIEMKEVAKKEMIARGWI